MKKTIDILILSSMILIALAVQTKSESYINSPPKSTFALLRRTVCIVKDDNIMSRKIPLTQGQFAIVDDEDFEWLNQWKWFAHKTTYGTYIAERRIYSNGKQESIRMHRFIVNAPSNLYIDHRNHQTLDNRRCNLRICTRAENQHNQIPRKETSSKYKGVWRNKKTQKWQVSIMLNGQSSHLGLFVNEIEAAKSYDRAALKLFGEFAQTNF